MQLLFEPKFLIKFFGAKCETTKLIKLGGKVNFKILKLKVPVKTDINTLKKY